MSGAASGDDLPAGETSRAASRARTLAALEQAALAELREHGAVELSLRRVARRLGRSPAGVYRYVDSREALLTLLITRAYDDLADHLLVALGEPPSPARGHDRAVPNPPRIAGPDHDVADRMRAVGHAYRAWAVGHRQEFGLLFGDPIPGYAAPPGGPTVVAMTRVGAALGRPLLEAWQQGRLRLGASLPAPLAAALNPMQAVWPELSSELAAVLLTAWGRLHGQVSLEVFGQHDWLFPAGAEALFDLDVERMLGELGVVAGPVASPEA